MRTALIDGDSIAYVLGWNLRDEREPGHMHLAVDSFMRSHLVLLEATHYVGALSSKPVFRDQVYKYAKYKGNRPDPHEAIQYWKPIVTEYLRSKWEFFSIPNLEADDVVGYLSFEERLGERIICSPDKDLRQVPGQLFDYNKGEMWEVDPQSAKAFLLTQMLCGDSTDNIKGVPGIGEVKAKSIVEQGEAAVYAAYVKYFGNYYGAIIHEETLATVMVMQPGHTYDSYFERQLKAIQPTLFEREDELFLRELESN